MAALTQPQLIKRIGRRSNKQKIWESIRARRQDFSIFLIHSDTLVESTHISHYMDALHKGGFIQQAYEPANQREGLHYKLIKDVGIECPQLHRDGSIMVSYHHADKILWRTINILREFSIKSLIAHANTPLCELGYSKTRRYLQHLEVADYLGRRKRGKEAVFFLKPGKYTGPRPPVIGRKSFVFDPNLDQIVWQEEIQHDDD
ncbi:hypothetical protein [Iodobacter sp.]|uniref:hypothetical protein n=1 Tax=Iodobacter sp. TaxID=1915058 RepID=UPI0025F37DF1|nr:hypothetical protein [Iodobacter sp.]